MDAAKPTKVLLKIISQLPAEEHDESDLTDYELEMKTAIESKSLSPAICANYISMHV